MKKSEFDFQPDFVVNEGNQVRINFDVEQVEKEYQPTGGEGEPQVRQIYEAYVVRVPMPLSADDVRNAVMAMGFDSLKADVVATEAMFVNGGSSDVELAKAMVTAKIMERDSSSAVNEFTLGGTAHWIPREYREMFAARLEQERRRGHSIVSINLPDAQPGDEPLSVEVETAAAMLDQLNDYATDCYDRTQAHKRAVAALTTLDEVLLYDYTQGYPPKLSF